MGRAFLVFVVLFGAAACGQKGPLYFRDNPPPGIKPPKTDQYKPVPYPKNLPADAERDGAAEK
jgi:predicted small lipoprotein YifL